MLGEWTTDDVRVARAVSPRVPGGLAVRRFLIAAIVTCIAWTSAAQAQVTAPATPSLPASAETAQDALTNSPRHGEFVDVPVPGTDAKIKSFVVYPERADNAPVVIVIHEIFGLTDWVRAVADQLAAEGFIAIAPDLLSGKGPGGGGTESFQGDSVRDAVRGLPPDEVTQRLNAVRDYAIALPASTDKTATIGFCWGGSTSFTYATHQPQLNAAVVYYGTGPSDAEATARINAPVLGLYGGDDARVNSTLDGTIKAMQDAGKSFAHHTYDNAGHGFLRQQSGQDGANQKASEQAWGETIGFLKQNLE